MPSQPHVAIVILNYNGCGFLQQFLPGVIRYSENCEIIIADNASTDDSVAFLRKQFPDVRLIILDKNYGFAEGYNQALAQVEADYYVLLNSDVEVSKGWVQPVIQLLEAREDMCAAQPKILSYHQKDHFEHAGAGGGLMDYLAYPFCRGRIFDTLEKDEGQYDDVREVFWATGACFFIKADAYRQAGGLDGDFFAHMEEIDLCWRLQRMGFKIGYQGQSKVWHVGGGTLGKSNPRKTYLNFRNGLWMLYKNAPAKRLLPRIFLRMVLDGIAAFKFLLSDGGGHFLAVLKAHRDFYLHLPELNKKRKNFKTIHPRQAVIDLYPKSIVREYFIKGKRIFADLGDVPRNNVKSSR